MSETFRDDGTERDAGLAALYRAAAREEPPPALDDAIRAAARRVVSSRPQRVNSPFIRSWRMPLSIAAVMLLTVSLVTVMREEAPEILSPPGGVRTVGEADQMRAAPAADAGERASAVPKTLAPAAPRPDSLGLKPPAQTGSSGLGLRGNRVSPDPVPGSPNDMDAARRMETDAPTTPALAKRALPQAFPEAVDMRDDKGVVAAEKRRQSAKEESPASPARAAEGKVNSKSDSVSADIVPRESSRARVAAAAAVPPSASAPASRNSDTLQPGTDLPPDKWLERIEDLRRQGRLEEAKTSLGVFRKRYPDYELPAALKAWAGL